MHKKTKSAGFSLVEVLVAVGLLAVISVAMTELIGSTIKHQKGVQAKDQQHYISTEIRNLLSDKKACINTFASMDPTAGLTVSDIRDATASPGATVYMVGGTDKSKLLKFSELKLEAFIADPNYARWGKSDFNIKLEKVDTTTGVVNIRPDPILLKIKLHPTLPQIIECFSVSSQTDGLWQLSPVVTTNIFYNGGSVGIGTNDPKTQLEVASGDLDNTSINVKNTALGGRTYGLFSTATSSAIGPGKFSISDVTALGIPRLVIDLAGNVGIGSSAPTTKLDVAGEIKIGSSGVAACSPGSQRYNGAFAPSGRMEFCDNTGTWHPLGGGNVGATEWASGGICVRNCGWVYTRCPSGYVMTGFGIRGSGASVDDMQMFCRKIE